MKNYLQNELSTYLRQHKNNPVNWHVWGSEAFAQAKKRNCPIFVSIGYASCHWCHVMARECFADIEIAKYLNEHFVAIKIDKEERPDIDNFYMNALHLTGEQGGWPLSMFCDYDGKPIFGGTYFPKHSAYRRIGFLPLIKNIKNAWQQENSAIKNNSTILIQHLQKLNSIDVEKQIIDKKFLPFLDNLLAIQDKKNGGMQGSPKFPNSPYLDCLYIGFTNYGNLLAKESFLKTMQGLCLGGIYDHLAGGLARYSVDEFWLLPHFEKMLYDNANFIRQLNLAYKLTKNKLFQLRIVETINWLKTEMLQECAICSSLDADSEGIEGKYYVWHTEEIYQVLGEAADEFIQLYKIEKNGNWQNVNIINLLHVNFMQAEKIVISQQQARAKLLAARKKRIAPTRDEKILSEWNGYMIEALIECDLALAENVFAAVCKINIIDDELVRCLGFKNHVRATASDYTAIINAALGLFAKTNKENYLAFAIKHGESLCKNYFNQSGALLQTHKNYNDLPLQLLACSDDVNISAAGQFVKLAMQIYFYTGDINWYERAEKMLEFLMKFFNKHNDSPGLYFALEWFNNSQMIYLCGSGDELNLWLEVLDENMHFARLVKIINNSKQLPPQIKCDDFTTISAFICQAKTCSAPIYDLQNFAKSLAKI